LRHFGASPGTVLNGFCLVRWSILSIFAFFFSPRLELSDGLETLRSTPWFKNFTRLDSSETSCLETGAGLVSSHFVPSLSGRWSC
jgi:hypothetical protein